MLTADKFQQVANHYERGDVGARILAALRAAGKLVDALTLDDLAPVDQFHIRGQLATRELLDLAQLKRGSEVLDVGGGLGGPARVLASDLGCHVTVLDLAAAFCQAGELLTTRAGLQAFVTFRQGNALDLPFPAASFDAVWTQHSSMNIADKQQLYGEMVRVLRPGGKLALNEVMAGAEQPLHFPVPWASHSAISFLNQPTEVRALITQAGFNELIWQDVTTTALAWLQTRQAAQVASGTQPALGLHLVLGPEVTIMGNNLMRNLAENRATVVYGVFEKPR
ncbi:class I SAM-dependent methyltransferase [soil metagenome]